MRFPSLAAFVTRAAWRLPPRSRARRTFLLRAAHFGFDAVNRGDFESGFLLYHPEIELITPPRLVGVGFEPVYRGREARFDFQRRWTAEWGEMRFEPEEMLDLGDRLLFVGPVKGKGVSSGAAFETDWAVLYGLSAGRLIRRAALLRSSGSSRSLRAARAGRSLRRCVSDVAGAHPDR